ncbi:MAG: ankyrin repeat domain-containing protein [Sphingomonas sp.]
MSAGCGTLLASGAALAGLGGNLDLNGAAFHGHWRLCEYLVEQGADPNRPLADTGETPLHAALCRFESLAHEQVVRVLLAAGADPNAATIPGAGTGGFMRDVRTRGETPLHRAAAYGTAGAIRAADRRGRTDRRARRQWRHAAGLGGLGAARRRGAAAAALRGTPLHPEYAGMAANLIGKPLS